MTLKRNLTATAILLAVAGPAAAAVTATATTDLNMRSGPGTEFPVTDVIHSTGQVSVESCVGASGWCKVSYDGQSGWASSSYLNVQPGQQVVVGEAQPQVLYEVPVGQPTAERIDDKTTLYHPAPKVLLAPVQSSALVPVAPQAQAVTYVQQNPVQPVYLDGDVVVGAGIPGNVTLYPVPETQYQYVNVNDHIVLVEPEGRRIVEVVR